MWIVRELVRLAEKIAIAFVVAVAIAGIWAALSEHSFRHDFRTTCLLVGAFTLLTGAIGRNNAFERRMDYGITEKAWGRIPGISTLKLNPEDPSLTPGAVLGGAGLALLAVGLFVL
jgi:heme O synthase-like polyprenyltransferase